MPTHGWRNLTTSLSARTTRHTLKSEVNEPMICELPERTPEQCSGQVKRISAPSRIRTYDTRFRKPLLYPLSYGG